MRVAVIGGTGFLGRHIVEKFAAAGHVAVAVARHPPSVPRGDEAARYRTADATQPHPLEEAISGCDAVINTAGSLRQSRQQTFHDIYVKGARQLVAACRQTRVRRLLHVSSLGARATSRSSFHRAKFAGEELVRHALLDATVLRPSAMFGPGDDFVNPLADLLERFPLAPLPGDGSARLQPVFVDDVAQAALAALDRDDTVGIGYDVPGPEALSIEEVYDRLMSALGLKRPKVRVPYLVIEPLTHLFGTLPGVPFSFDQLAILEEELGAHEVVDPSVTAHALGLTLRPFDTDAIRQAVGAGSTARAATP